jgi:hypothetical protein
MSNDTTWNKDQKELWKLMQKINNCWYKGDPQHLSDFFHPNIVINSPDFRHSIIGKDNCIQTYIDFMNISTILLYRENNPSVQIFEKTAIVTYHFEMKYEQKGKTFHETGTDILVFEKDESSWKVIWRALSNLQNI